jgi:hypothetical protein
MSTQKPQQKKAICENRYHTPGEKNEIKDREPPKSETKVGEG